MYPSKPSGNPNGSNKEFEASKYPGVPSSNPSAPLLPSYDPAGPPPNAQPPPYSSVVGQDNSSPYPPGASHISNANPSSGFGKQPPYPSGPGLAQGTINQTPYPSYGAPAQAPYPPGPVTSQPPYPTGPGYTPGPASQAPYPVASMPMPGPVDHQSNIGFTAPVTTEPKFGNAGYPPQGGYGAQNGQGMVYPTPAGESHQYVQNNQWGQNAYPQQQQQQPQTIYVVQKAPENNTSSDDCCLIACCLASCYCLCECIKVCASD